MNNIYVVLWLSLNIIITTDGQKYSRYSEGQFTGYVVGGVEVPITMYPHVAVVIIDRSFLCGGSIVSDRVIVTAAHCVMRMPAGDPYPPYTLQVILGSSARGLGRRHNVCKVIPHKAYETTSYFHDIALLMLTRRIKYKSSIQKVEIAPDESWRNEKYSFTVAGFGRTENKGMISDKLMATRMHYVDSATCNKTQSNIPMIVPNHMFCMIGQRWTSDCTGDSGSGIIWRGYLVGLVALGRDNFCGSDMMPSMYTDVTYFRKWIDSNINEAHSLSDKNCPSKRKKRKLFFRFNPWTYNVNRN